MLKGLNHITIAVSDLDRSVDFYSNTLGMKVHVAWAQGAYLSAGDLWFCLSADSVCAKNDYTHIAFSVAQNHFQAFCEQLKVAGVVEWQNNTSEGDSLYFLDPDGHKLEIHAGNLYSRLESLKKKPYANLNWQ